MYSNKKTANETGSSEYSLSRLKVKALLYCCLFIVALLTVFQHNASGRNVVYWKGGTGNWYNEEKQWDCNTKTFSRHNPPKKNEIAHIKNDGIVKMCRKTKAKETHIDVHRLILGDKNTHGSLIICNDNLYVRDAIVLGPGYYGREENFGIIRMDPGSFIWTKNMYAGLNGLGQIFINGGELEVDNMTVGVYSNATGYVHLSGHKKGTEMDCKKTAVIGDLGKGEVFVSEGGIFKADRLIVGNKSGSTGIVTVSGNDSKIKANSIEIGSKGKNALLKLTAGGSSQSDTLYVGKDTGSEGAVSVSGKDSNVKTNYGHIGILGDGSLNLMDGGSLTVTKKLYIGSLEGAKGTVTVSGKASFLDIKTGETFVGYVGTGTMEISEKGLVRTSGKFYVGNSEISNGTVMVSGPDSRLETGTTFIGRYGKGTMEITSGGQVDAKDVHIGGGVSSNGIVTMSGQSSFFESELLSVGLMGEGKLFITDGAQMNVGTFQTGYAPDSKGSVMVSGVGSRLETETMYIGSEGNGKMHILSGGQVDGKNVHIGGGVSSNGIITVLGQSSFFQSEFLTVGLMGDGKLVITDAAQMNAGTFQTGYAPDSKGSVMVSGVNSRLETETMYIGSDGNGTLDITSGGQVRVKQGYVGYGTHSNGRITVSGIVRYGDVGVRPITQSGLSELSALFEPEVLTVGFMGNGNLVIENGGRMNTGSFHVGSINGSKGSVTVSGQGSLVQTPLACVGGAGNGILDITSGGRMNANEFNTGMETGATSTVTVLGTGSVLETEKAMIGYHGGGVLNIADGAEMKSREAVYVGYLSGANGRISVSGEGSRLESVAAGIGYYSRGTLDITSGGATHVTGFQVGRFPNAIGIVTVSGEGSRLESGDICIAHQGEGTLNITNGGQVSSRLFVYGQHPDATGSVTVSGPGSRLDAETAWISGEGNLNITEGGQMYSRLFVYGQYPDATGSVTVSGPGSRLDAETVSISFGFDRNLDIRDGGHMRSGVLEIRRSAITVSGQDSLLSSRQVALGLDGSDASISVTDGGEIRFEESFEIRGTGTLKVSDGGRFSMAPGGFFTIAGPGASAFFDGPASFDGHVHVNGTLSAPTVSFSPSSRITGSQEGIQGCIRGDVILHGTLSPGGATDPVSTPGTLVIDGSYTHEAGSRYVAGIDVDNQVSDRVEVSGNTLLNGGIIEAVWTGHVTGEERFTVLTSANIEGEFDTLAGDTALVKVGVEKTPESVDIVLTRTDYTEVAVTGKNPGAAGKPGISKALDDLSSKPGHDMGQVLGTLDRMADHDQVRDAYDQMTPAVVAGSLAVTLDTLRRIGDITGRRAAFLGSERSLGPEPSLYLHPLGSMSYRGGDHDHPAYRAGTMGFLAGIEKRAGSFFTGARAIYASSNIHWKDPGRSSSRTDQVTVGFYGGYLAGPWHLYASMDGGGLFHDTRRRMKFGGIDRTATGSPGGHLFAVESGAGLHLDLGWGRLSPRASLRYARLTRKDYTETGAGDLNLSVGQTEVDSLRSTLGLTLTAPGIPLSVPGIPLSVLGGLLDKAGGWGRSGTGIHITPELTAAWYHEFMGQNRFDMVSSLSGGGRPFATTQAVRDADLFGFGPGLDLDITDTVSGYLRYEGILGDTSMNHNLYAGITIRF